MDLAQNVTLIPDDSGRRTWWGVVHKRHPTTRSFAEFILGEVEGLRMTRYGRIFVQCPFDRLGAGSSLDKPGNMASTPSRRRVVKDPEPLAYVGVAASTHYSTTSRKYRS